MDISLFLARSFGIYLLVISLAMLINYRYFSRIMSQMIDHPPAFLVASIMTLILGIILIQVHNFWQWDWRLLVTLLCWLTFIKGVVNLCFPAVLEKWQNLFKGNLVHYYLPGINFILALYLLYCGFIPNAGRI